MPAPTSRSPRTPSKTPSSASPRRLERENRKDSDMTTQPAPDATAQPCVAPRPASTASADFLASLDERRAPAPRRILRHPAPPRTHPQAAQPTHAHLHDDHARGLLPHLRPDEQGPN